MPAWLSERDPERPSGSRVSGWPPLPSTRNKAHARLLIFIRGVSASRHAPFLRVDGEGRNFEGVGGLRDVRGGLAVWGISHADHCPGDLVPRGMKDPGWGGGAGRGGARGSEPPGVPQPDRPLGARPGCPGKPQV